MATNLAVSYVEPCSEDERQFFTQLFTAHARTGQDIKIAWTTFCLAHGLPLTFELEGVAGNGLLVKGERGERGG